MKQLAHLVLEDGTIFQGITAGVEGETVGEIVFNTAMTGYQEILTDPSYSGQIISFTCPHIGNVGTNKIDEESDKIYANGIIVRSISYQDSNFRSTENLSQYIKKKNIIAITDVDTRKITHILRKYGSQYGCIQSAKYMNIQNAFKKIEINKNIKKNNPIISIGTKNIKKWNIENSQYKYTKKIFHVIVFDFGIKTSILNILEAKGCKITLIPFDTPINIILSLKPSGILLSNGPGDPRSYYTAIKNIKKLLNFSIPIFGICLGHQILALSLGSKIIKMKFGHHGSNHPVQNIQTKRVFITTQNHNFVIDPKTIQKNMLITHISLFDKTIQGITLKNHPSFSFQGHPESNPGTHDIQKLFDIFINNMKNKEKFICPKETI
ncbi:Carbamoyl-phosphate synthase small chain [Buchnera aphidicola (Cinara piceae)]|uniref:Carbamoyl phosphate synthase small chain n=1 Tax=Buchnera aphidicola (Cinara piceae) TaxID=1660043 RepID=A0A803GCH0_9GAMM|nr:glutamine-hydrolyzing carbamoyl-phosphate synthase small subunit [Buchnera aphidicola]VFP88012.1 Carbamoyl-phosphate synthase small chain [Buchnera aphidicola (Cinara piceae)]